jgi:hypothetical protein
LRPPRIADLAVVVAEGDGGFRVTKCEDRDAPEARKHPGKIFRGLG